MKMKPFSGDIMISMLLGAIFGVWVCLRMIFGAGGDLKWIIFGSVALLCLIICGWGMRRHFRWALWFSWALAAAALGLGYYAARFAWSFWIFEVPTLEERIRSVLTLDISLLVIVPVLWLFYFTRKRTREQFVN